jgi:hypothetical protein
MVMIRNWLLRLFGLSEIVARQAVTIDRLQMQCIERDLYYELWTNADETMFGMAMRGRLWEPNDVY